MSNPGRLRIKLAAMLQRDIPEWRGQPITWAADKIWPVKGWYRTSRFADNYRWEAGAYFTTSPDNVAFVVSSWATITNCVKAKRLELDETMNERLINPRTEEVVTRPRAYLKVPGKWLKVCGHGDTDRVFPIKKIEKGTLYKTSATFVTVDRDGSPWLVHKELRGAEFVDQDGTPCLTAIA